MGQVRSTRRDGVRVITLDSPFTMNAWTVEMHAAMLDEFNDLRSDPDTRAVVLTGAGDRAFCAGRDHNEGGSDDASAWLISLKRVFGAVLNCDKPVVAAIRGVAYGSGYQLALLCDLRVANPDARFGQPEVASGIPSISGSYLTRQFVGHGLASEMMLAGRLLSGEEAHGVGLVHRVVPGGGVVDEAVVTAIEMADIPVPTFTATKRALRAQISAGLARACDEAISAGSPGPRPPTGPVRGHPSPGGPVGLAPA